MSSEIRLPNRLSALLISAYVTTIFIVLYLLTIFYTVAVYRTGNYVRVLLVLLFFLPLFVHGLTVLYFIKRVYPAGEIPRFYLIIYNIVDVIVIIFILICILGTIGILITNLSAENFKRTWSTIIGKFVYLALGIVLLTQLYIVIEGRSLIKLIRRNRRAELLESI